MCVHVRACVPVIYSNLQWCHLETDVIEFTFTFRPIINVKKEGKDICVVFPSAFLSTFTDMFVQLVNFTFFL